MSEHLRGFVSRRLSLVGLQLQVFWQKTLTSGHSLKQVLSPQSSPRTAHFPSTKPDDDQSRETFLPVFTTNASSGMDNAPSNSASALQQTEITQTAPSADHSTNTPATSIDPTAGIRDGETQTETLDNDSIRHRKLAEHVPSPNINAATQTEPWTPPMDQSTLVADSEPKEQGGSFRYEGRRESFGNDDPPADFDTGLSNQSEYPEVFHGESQMVVTDFNGKKHFAILVTKEMIKDLNGMLEQNSKLESVLERLHHAKHKVTMTNVDISYLEDGLEESQSQEFIDEQREAISRLQNMLPTEVERRDSLQELADIHKIHRDCSAESCIDTLQKVLTDANLLETQFGPTNQDSNMADRASQSASNQIEPALYEAHSPSTASSEIGIDELYLRTVNEEVAQKYHEYYEAEQEFDGRHEQYAQTNERYRRMRHEGACSMTQTEFDHCDFEAVRELGNYMAAAEEAYEEALARCNKLGHRGFDQESGFLDDEYDGYPLSWENDGIVSAPRGFIDDWLQGIPEVESLLNITELNEPGGANEFKQDDPDDVEECDIRSAQMSDTWSCRDLTRNRRRIDKWNEITGRDK
ncbi:MAG: hypothetical protein Q9170_006778 [Blastenia crenularia]